MCFAWFEVIVVYGLTSLAQAPATPEPLRADGYAAWLSPREVAPAPSPATGPADSEVAEAGRFFCGVFAPAVNKTFFAYVDASQTPPGGSVAVAYFDHQAGTVPRPVLVPIKVEAQTLAGISLTTDANGLLWICIAVKSGPTILLRSEKPYDIAAFLKLPVPDLQRGAVQVVPGHGLILFGLRAEKDGTVLCCANSVDGKNWSEPKPLAAIDAGQTYLSGAFQNKVSVAVAGYLAGQNAGQASDLYYLETLDGGNTWQSAKRARLELPIHGGDGPARAWEYRPAKYTVHLKDLNADARGNVSILYLASRVGRNGRSSSTWTTSRWIGHEWETTGIIPASSPGDAGLLYVEPDRSWRVLTARNGPPPQNDNRVLLAWSSDDLGRSWYKLFTAGGDTRDRQEVCRPVSALPGLYSFWITAGEKPSAVGRIRILDREGQAFALPLRMSGADEKPQPLAETTQPAPRTK